MARRRRNKGVLDLLTEQPWLITLVLGVIILGVSGGGNSAPVALVLKIFAYACFFASALAAIKSLGRIDLILSGKGQKSLVQCKRWRSF